MTVFRKKTAFIVESLQAGAAKGAQGSAAAAPDAAPGNAAGTSAVRAAAGGAQAEGLVLCMTKTELESDAGGLKPELAAAIRRLREKGTFAAESGQTEVLPTYGLLDSPYVLLAGLGDAPVSADMWRAAAVYAARAAIRHKLASLAVRLPEEAVRPFTEGVLLGTYRIASYRHDLPQRHELERVVYTVDGDSQACLEHIRVAEAYAEGTNYARDLTNMPGNLLTPAKLADEAVKLAEHHGFQVEIWDERQIAERGAGGLHEVGKGSANPPRMIVLRYQGKDEWDDVLGLVGKGVTFDTGGISMKKPEGMEEMISDMGGAATLLGLMHIVGCLRPKINLVVVIPAAENMPSGSAFKPGDVITLMNGHTVEVLNTDAEGRIVLADGVILAKRLGASKLIDVATLTGAILICFGDVATGAVTNDDAFLAPLLQAAKRAGEKLWQLPNYPEYRDMLKSDVADIKNATAADRWAGAITAGLFVGKFAGETPWIHLDTGGTAWLWSEKGIEPKGGTGVMVRTLAEYIRGLEKGD